MRREDWLLHQLPVGMVEDDFLSRFLRIFQSVADTELHQIDALRHMFDPTVAPDGMVRLMGPWIGVDWIDPSLPDELQRRIVMEYASLVWLNGKRRDNIRIREDSTIAGRQSRELTNPRRRTDRRV